VTRVYVATKNPGKMRELREIFAGTSFEVDTFADYADVVEGENSYAENAALKARALRGQLEAAGIVAAVLGDDSGLEVRALGNRPGVLSARYGGPSATWSERRLALIGELAAAGSSDRSARFVCALHFIDADGIETATLETNAGEIAQEERGEAGFSYDPIFFVPERGVTFAELSTEEKNRISHRARAAAALLSALETASAEPEPAPSGGN
jgi:XTP/dITP diphosphohydrolase